MRPFKLPKKTIGDLDADTAARLISMSADLALVIDAKGVIRDIAVENEDLAVAGMDRWIGRPWIETVTIDSRPKIEELLADASPKQPTRWRQVNHPATRRRTVPVRYAALGIKGQGSIVAVGRNLQAMADLQQQILNVQRQLDIEYSELRRSETRYRALFYSTSEAVIIADLSTLKIVDANPAACDLVGKLQRKLVGRTYIDLFDVRSIDDVQASLGELRASPHSRDRVVKLAGRPVQVNLASSVARHDGSAVFMIARFSALDAGLRPHAASSDLQVHRLIASMPDAFVVTGPSGSIQAANDAFLSLVQLAREDQVVGQPLDRWLGRGAADFAVLLANLKEHGSIKRFQSMVAGEFGASEDVEIAAVSALASNPPVIGFVMRPLERRDIVPGNHRGLPNGLPHTAEQLAELVGRVPLKDLVRETTDIIERMCIEAALSLTKDNRASAAELLGLSRQGLYTKLRRYGIDDAEA